MKTVAVVGILLLLCPIVAYEVLAIPTADEFILRLEVFSPGSEVVKISAPLSLIHTVFDLLPAKIRNLTEKGGLEPEQIVKELETLGGEDLVRIEGRDNVRIWLEPVTNENRRDLGFLKIHVREMNRHGQEINVCLPRGLVQLAATTVKILGLTDKMVELPPCLEEIGR
jgi:hypothetical protein